MNLTDYQQKAVDWLCEHERGLVVAPAGSGKTVIAAAALARVMGAEPEHNPTVGWMANTKEQRQQGDAAIRRFLPPGTFDLALHCAAADVNYSACDVLVVDEAHHGLAPTWRKQIESCRGVRWGFTATPPSGEALDELLSLFSGNMYVVEREAVAERLCPATVHWLDPEPRTGLCDEIEAAIEKELARRMRFRRYQVMPKAKARGEVAWQVCAELGIAGNAERSRCAVQAVLEAEEDTPAIILCNYVDHAMALAGVIPRAVACYAAMGTKARKQAMADFKSGKITRLVATTLADEGLDLPMAEVLVLVSGGRNEARTIQRTGRVLRTHPGKSSATIYDFVDSFHPLMAKHARRRAEIYEDLGYEQVGRPE